MLYTTAVPTALLWNAVLFVALVGALVAIVLSTLRKPARPTPTRATEPPTAERGPAEPAPAAAPAPVTSEAQVLDAEAAIRKLYEHVLGADFAGRIPPEHERIAAAIANSVEAASTDPRFAPRRPMLLPQLLRALGDTDTSRREVADLIARDPALVGSLLKLVNSPLHRVGEQPIESIDRAVAMLGTDGVRALVAAALLQPMFAGDGALADFPRTVWDHSYRSGAAAAVHAASTGSDLFAAQLLALVTGLAAIVVFRVAVEHYGRAKLRPDATAIATVLDTQTAVVARTIAASWELSARMLEALDDQLPGTTAEATSLGRSLRFGLVAGALSVLETNGALDAEIARASYVAGGGVGSRFERLWPRLGGLES